MFDFPVRLCCFFIVFCFVWFWFCCFCLLFWLFLLVCCVCKNKKQEKYKTNKKTVRFGRTGKLNTKNNTKQPKQSFPKLFVSQPKLSSTVLYVLACCSCFPRSEKTGQTVETQGRPQPHEPGQTIIIIDPQILPKNLLNSKKNTRKTKEKP